MHAVAIASKANCNCLNEQNTIMQLIALIVLSNLLYFAVRFKNACNCNRKQSDLQLPEQATRNLHCATFSTHASENFSIELECKCKRAQSMQLE